MARLEYSWEVRERAKELYVVDGLTFEQAAAATEVSVTQLKRWSADEQEWGDKQEEGQGKDWPAARREFRLALGAIRRDSVLLRAKLITGALGDPEFKRVLSAAMWERTQTGKAGPQAGKPGPLDARLTEPPGGLPVIRTPQDAVAALEAVVARRVGLLATRPELLSFSAIKDLQKTLGLIEELRTRYQAAAAAGQAPGLSDEAADEIRRQILGVQ